MLPAIPGEIAKLAEAVEAAACADIQRAAPSAFAGFICQAFERPPSYVGWIAALVGRPVWTHYLALDGDMLVGADSLFVQGEAGWISLSRTLPPTRRQGCNWLSTEAEEETANQANPSVHNMLRTGFQLAYPRRNYLPAWMFTG